MVAVLSNTGIRLMPTSSYRARKLLKSGCARIYKYEPVFTIQLLCRENGETQPVEYKSDTGYTHVGISVCSQKHEYVSEQRDLLADETQKHDERRKNRRLRRNRLRYRKPRFDNRVSVKKPGWLAPGVKNRMERQVHLFQTYAEVIPITEAVFEMGKFDTQLLQALESGQPVPKGTDYQQGPRYQSETLRQAVFSRDGYTCVFCGRSIKDHAKLHMHHLGYLNGDHSNRMGNLATACEKCHTPRNHRPGGILYGAEPKLKTFKGATFMSMVRWKMYELLTESFPDIQIWITYGAKTKLERKKLHVEKSHANDAYAIGLFHPKHRTQTMYFKKRRRNNRVLEKFYDAKYIDSRTGKKATGQELFSGRAKRNKELSGENLHQYRSQKVSKGRRTIRRQHYLIQPGSIVRIGKQKHSVVGVHCNGTRVILDNKRSIAVKKVKVLKYSGGWIPLGKEKWDAS